MHPPWGLGGWLAIDGVITEYFASQLTKADSEKFGIPLADACGQKVWEALAMLTALWSATWKQRRIILKITGDNVTALTLAAKMRPPSPELAIIARELAFRLIEQSFPPDAQHSGRWAHIRRCAVAGILTDRRMSSHSRSAPSYADCAGSHRS